MHKIISLAFLITAICFSVNAQNVITTEYLGDRSQANLADDFGFFIQNGVELYKITYTTPDIHGQLDTASGLFVVPVRDEVTIYPTLIYNHGTVDGPQDVPSNETGGYELALFFGGLGYATLAPDYLGAGESRGFHPYVHADSEASAGADMVRAIKAHAPEMDILLNDQLFITGYSQGGHASMALHRYIETEAAEEFNMTAAAHLSGPYSISEIMLNLILDDEPYYYVAYTANTFLSYNTVYNVYDGLEHVFKAEYVDAMQDFHDGTIGLGQLNGFLIDELVNTYGAPITRHLMHDSIVAILETPDSDHPLHLALRDNDVYDWAPQLPTRMYYCMNDDQVNYRNAIIADSVMQSLNAPDVSRLDVSPESDHGECVVPAVSNTVFFFGALATWTIVTDVEGISISSINVSPNPAKDRVFIEGLQSRTKATLFSSSGQLILEAELTEYNNTLSLKSLPDGLYFLNMSNSEGQLMKKILVGK